jgi:DNA invertase Pin-like site-specific DNA recombinase
VCDFEGSTFDKEALLSWALESPPTSVHLFSKSKKRRSRLGGRLDRRPKRRREFSQDWTQRAFEKLVFIYMRFSTREQREKNAYSYERQEGLKQLAIQQGARSELSRQGIEQVRARPDYPGWYQDGQIIVEERDLVGVSGTKGQEDRPGLAHLISLIEQGLVSAIYVVDVTSLTREEYLVDASQFVKLFAEKGVFVVTEGMVFDLTLENHRDLFMFQAQYAAKELKMILSRLGGSRRAKARMGRYAGDQVPIGYVVLRDKATGRLNDYSVHEPQASIVRLIFAKFLELRRIQAVARWCNKQGILIPAFDPEWGYMNTRNSVRSMRAVKGPDGKAIGYKILRSTVGYILENPMYIGRIYREGQMVKENSDLMIVDEETFWAVQAILEKNQPRSRGEPTSRLLAGLVFCTVHDGEKYLVYSTSTGYQCSHEQCAGLTQRRCFIVGGDIFDVPVSEAVLSVLSYADRADQIITQLEEELSSRKSRAQAYKSERKRLESERGSLVESLAFLQAMEKDAQRRKKLFEEIHQEITERETELEELARKELAPFEDVLTTTEISMVREFLTNLSTRWDEIPNKMRNNFLSVILSRILVEEEDDHFNLRIIWRSGFEQRLVTFRPPTSVRKHRWSQEEEALIRKHYPTALPEEMIEMLPSMPWHEIRRRAHRLGVGRGYSDRTGTRNPHWTPEEDRALRDYDECKIAYTEMFEALSHRSYAGIRRRANILGIDFAKRRIVWRFVDSFHENECSRGAGRDRQLHAPLPSRGSASRLGAGRC